MIITARTRHNVTLTHPRNPEITRQFEKLIEVQSRNGQTMKAFSIQEAVRALLIGDRLNPHNRHYWLTIRPGVKREIDAEGYVVIHDEITVHGLDIPEVGETELDHPAGQ